MMAWHAALKTAASPETFETQLGRRSATERSNSGSQPSLLLRLRHRLPTFQLASSRLLSRLEPTPGRTMFRTWGPDK